MPHRGSRAPVRRGESCDEGCVPLEPAPCGEYRVPCGRRQRVGGVEVRLNVPVHAATGLDAKRFTPRTNFGGPARRALPSPIFSGRCPACWREHVRIRSGGNTR